MARNDDADFSNVFKSGNASESAEQLQKFYEPEQKQDDNGDEEDLFAEIYGEEARQQTRDLPLVPPKATPEIKHQPPSVSDTTNVADSAATAEKPDTNTDDIAVPDAETKENEASEDEEGSEEEDESDDDVQVVLSGSGDIVRPTPTRVKSAHQYVRGESNEAEDAPAAVTEAVKTAEEEDAEEAAEAAKIKAMTVEEMIPPVPVGENGQELPYPSVYDVDIDALDEKPWRAPDADITDWFNYGFKEDSWRTYCQRQVQLRLSQQLKGRINVYESGGGGGPPPGFDGPYARPMQRPPMRFDPRMGPLPMPMRMPPGPMRPPRPLPPSEDVIELGGGGVSTPSHPEENRTRDDERGSSRSRRDRDYYRDERGRSRGSERRSSHDRDDRRSRDRGHERSSRDRDRRDRDRGSESRKRALTPSPLRHGKRRR